MDKAAKIQMGAEISMAITVTHSEPIINGKKPNFPLPGFHIFENNKSPRLLSTNNMDDL